MKRTGTFIAVNSNMFMNKHFECACKFDLTSWDFCGQKLIEKR